MYWNGAPHEPHHFPDPTESRCRLDRVKAWMAGRPFVHRLLDVAILGAFPGVGAYARFFAPHLVEVTEHEVPVVNLSSALDGLRVVHLSDLHAGRNVPTRYLERCVEIANESSPDLVVLTGDYLQWDEGYIETLARLLDQLRAPLGVYAVLGNHDYGINSPSGPRLFDGATAGLVRAMESAGVRVLRNESTRVAVSGEPLFVVGVEDLWSGECDPEAAFRDVPPGTPVLFLCHNPDGFGYGERYRFDVMCSGHTHGGQVRLPISRQPGLPIRDRRLMAGVYGRRGSWVYVSRGLGYIWKVRLNSAPEIACLTLRRERYPGQSPKSYLRLRRHSRW